MAIQSLALPFFKIDNPYSLWSQKKRVIDLTWLLPAIRSSHLLP